MGLWWARRLLKCAVPVSVEPALANVPPAQAFCWILLWLSDRICAEMRASVSEVRVDLGSRTTTMRSGLICLTFAISIIPVVANAQVTIDMGSITCGQYLAMPPSQSDDFSAWMSGWFSYQSSKTYVDLVAHQKNIANVKDWCRYHPNESVMTGLQKATVIN
jgi:hypothetical protein